MCICDSYMFASQTTMFQDTVHCITHILLNRNSTGRQLTLNGRLVLYVKLAVGVNSYIICSQTRKFLMTNYDKCHLPVARAHVWRILYDNFFFDKFHLFVCTFNRFSLAHNDILLSAKHWTSMRNNNKLLTIACVRKPLQIFFVDTTEEILFFVNFFYDKCIYSLILQNEYKV